MTARDLFRLFDLLQRFEDQYNSPGVRNVIEDVKTALAEAIHKADRKLNEKEDITE